MRIKLGQYLAEAGQPAPGDRAAGDDAGDDPDALIALGNAFVVAGRPADAIARSGSCALDPANGLAYENIGAIQLQAKNFEAAETSLRKALELDEQLAGAHTALGVVLANTGRRDEAIDDWKRAVQLDRGELDALFNLTVNLVQTAGWTRRVPTESASSPGRLRRFRRMSLPSGGCWEKIGRNRR